jgi:hypothetical protein
MILGIGWPQKGIVCGMRTALCFPQDEYFKKRNKYTVSAEVFCRFKRGDPIPPGSGRAEAGDNLFHYPEREWAPFVHSGSNEQAGASSGCSDGGENPP